MNKNLDQSFVKTEQSSAYELAKRVDVTNPFENKIIKKAANMLRQQADRIAELEKQSEPYVWDYVASSDGDGITHISMPFDKWQELIKFVDAPQTKPLTEDEVNQIIKQQDWFSMSWVDMVRRIEKIIYSKSSTVPEGLTDPKSYYEGYEDGKAQTKPFSDEEIEPIIEMMADMYNQMNLQWKNSRGYSEQCDIMKAIFRAIEAKVRGQ